VTGTIANLIIDAGASRMIVELDDANERGETRICVALSYGYFDYAWCLTNHKSQGRTFDSAFVLANPAMADREWTYVAASRSRFATTLFVDASALGLIDPESHFDKHEQANPRQLAIDSLAARMRRSRAKGTALDYDDAPRVQDPAECHATGLADLWNWARSKTDGLAIRLRNRSQAPTPRR
jgi:hypothetical protein